MPSFSSKKIQILQRLKHSRNFEIANYNWMRSDIKELFLKELSNADLSKISIGRDYIYEEIPASATNFTFENVEHFSYYYVSIRACYDSNETEASCSNPAIILNLTAREYDADRIKNLRAIAVDSNAIELTWDSPSRPNGVILSFTIYFQLVDSDYDAKTLCLTFQQFSQEGQRKRIENLTPGKYSLSVMVRSLAGIGSLSEPIYVEVESNYSIYWIICSFVMILIVLVLLLMLQKRRLESMRDKNPFYTTFVSKPDDGFELERADIELLSELGSGHFGLVFEGILRTREGSGSFLKVAVKTVKSKNNQSSTSFIYLN